MHPLDQTPRTLLTGVHCSLITQTSISVFWLLLHIYQSPTLLATIREEIGSRVQIMEPNGDFKLPEPRRLTFVKNGEDISSTCPLLKATYIDIRRLYCINPMAARVDRAFSVKRDSATDPLTPVNTEAAPNKTLPTRSSAANTYTFKADTHVIGVPNAKTLRSDHDNNRLPSTAPTGHTPESSTNTTKTKSAPKQQPEPDDLINDFSLLPQSLSDLIEDLTLTTVAAILTMWDLEPIGTDANNITCENSERSGSNTNASTSPRSPSSPAAEIQKSTSPTLSSGTTDPRAESNPRTKRLNYPSPTRRKFKVPVPQWNSLLANPRRDIRVMIRPTTD